MCKTKVLNSHLLNVSILWKTIQEYIKRRDRAQKITYMSDMKKAFEKVIENIEKTSSIYDINNKNIT